MLRNNSPVINAERIGIEESPLSCCRRLMMLLAFSKIGTSNIDVIVKMTETVAAKRQ